MPTEQNSTQVTDASNEAHQSQGTEQNAKAHSEQSKTDDKSNTFDARRAFDSTNEKVNKLAEKFDKIDPDVITQIAEKLGVTKKEAEQKVEQNSPDVKAIVQGELWNSQNAERIAEANKNGKFDSYVKDGIKPEHALRLAEQDEGIRIDTSEQNRQRRNSSADGSVDREIAPEVSADEAAYGITAEDKKKYGDRAKRVQIVR